MKKYVTEMCMCYIEQYKFDVIIGSLAGLDLRTVLELNRISKEKSE